MNGSVQLPSGESHELECTSYPRDRRLDSLFARSCVTKECHRDGMQDREKPSSKGTEEADAGTASKDRVGIAFSCLSCRFAHDSESHG